MFLRKNRSIISLQGATCVSWLGDAMSNLALPWFVLQVTGSPTQTGISAVARAIGIYVATVVSGPYVDRLPGKRLSIICDLAAALLTIGIPLLYAIGGLESWSLYALIFLASIVQRPGYLARGRSLPEVAGHSQVRLERASGMNEMMYHSTLLTGPVIAGVLVGWIGAAWVLALDAVSFIFSALLVGIGVPGHLMTTPLGDASAARWSFRERFVEGLRFLKRDRLLILLALTVAGGILLVNAPLLSVILPVYVNASSGDAIGFGVMLSSFAVGALGGATLFTAVGDRLPRRALWVACYGMIGLPYAFLVLDAPPLVLAGAMGVFGLAEGLSTPLYATVRFRRVPQELRGRVFSALTPITGLAPTLGLLIPGLLIEPIGFREVIVILLLLTFGFWFWIALTSAFRQLEG